MKNINIKDHFTLKELKVNDDEHILIEMKGDWNDGDYVYGSEKMPLNRDTLAALYFLEVSKNYDNNSKIKDQYGDIFCFIESNFIMNLPNGYESMIHTLEYNLTYHVNKKSYKLDMIKDSIPVDIKKWIENIIKVFKIGGVYYYDNNLLNIILKIYNELDVDKEEIEILIDEFSDVNYEYDDRFANMLQYNLGKLPKDEIVEKVYSYLNYVYGK